MSRKLIHVLFAIALLAVVAGVSLGAADNLKKTTYFTFSSTVRLPGVTLPAGTYLFEVVNVHDRGDLVRVVSRDRSKIYALQFTYFVHRPLSANMKGIVRLGETRPGTAPVITSWFPADETLGRAFIY